LVGASVAAIAVLALAGTTLAMYQSRGSTLVPALTTSPTGATPSGTASGNANGAGAPSTSQPLGTIPPQPAPTTNSLPAPTTTNAPAPRAAVVITEATQGPVSVARGSELDVNLSRSAQAWSEPQSSDSNVLVRISGSTGPDGSAHAVFRAVADGSVSVFSSQAPPSCYPHCLPPQRALDFTVNVIG
jgi:hypothetical protein